MAVDDDYFEQVMQVFLAVDGLQLVQRGALP